MQQRVKRRKKSHVIADDDDLVEARTSHTVNDEDEDLAEPAHSREDQPQVKEEDDDVVFMPPPSAALPEQPDVDEKDLKPQLRVSYAGFNIFGRTLVVV